MMVMSEYPSPLKSPGMRLCAKAEFLAPEAATVAVIRTQRNTTFFARYDAFVRHKSRNPDSHGESVSEDDVKRREGGERGGVPIIDSKNSKNLRKP
jgi:hypothetical protein